MTPKQHEIYEQIKNFVISKGQNALHFPSDYPARDRKFIQNLAADLGIRHAIEYHEVNNEKHVYVEFNSDSEDEADSREGVWKKYEEADIVDESQINIEEMEKQKYEERFDKWKKDYYLTKMGLDYDDNEQMYQLVRTYIEGLQWVLHYYYNGVASWGWFFRYHYAPKISGMFDNIRSLFICFHFPLYCADAMPQT